jgi:hypothetical protein
VDHEDVNEGFDSHPGCLQFLEVRCGGPAWSLDVPHSAFWIVCGLPTTRTEPR